LFWGMRYVSSGTAGVLEMSLTPIALLGFGIALGQERWSWVNAIARGGNCRTLHSICALDQGRRRVGCLVHCRLRGHRLGGGILRLGLCARAAGDRALRQRYALGRDHADRRGRPASGLARLGAKLCSIFRGVLGGPATLGWLFLLLFGSLVGYSLYMQLLRDLGPAKAGSFAFVSPIIAVLVGVIAAGETASILSIAGMAIMLVAAGACLYGDELEASFARIARNGTRVVQKTCSSNTLMR
jgi:hypothetical protein